MIQKRGVVGIDQILFRLHIYIKQNYLGCFFAVIAHTHLWRTSLNDSKYFLLQKTNHINLHKLYNNYVFKLYYTLVLLFFKNITLVLIWIHFGLLPLT